MPGSFASVSVAADGTVWALPTERYDLAMEWLELDGESAGSLRWISVGSASSVWGVNSSGLVYKLNAATGGWETPTVLSGTFKGAGDRLRRHDPSAAERRRALDEVGLSGQDSA